MALKRCPDCGKMVSDKADKCPECGCPKEYFEMENEEDKETGNETVDSDNSYEENKIWENFTVLGTTITYYEEQKAYIHAARLHADNSSLLEKEIRKIYEKARSIDIVWDEIAPRTQSVIDKFINENVSLLYEQNILISETDYKKKYHLKYFDYLGKISDAYDKIINDANELQARRQYERSGRSQWQGGGFGLKGAVKGAITAGALNMVTGVGRSIGDSVVDGNDKAVLENAKQKMKEDKNNLQLLIDAMRYCIFKTDYGLAEELASHGYTMPVLLKPQNALENYGAAKRYEKDKKQLASKTFALLELYPFEVSLYKTILEVILYSPEELNELTRFIKFWNMDNDFLDLFEKIKKRDQVFQYIKSNPECVNIDLNIFRPDNYRKLKQIKNEIDTLIGSHETVELVPFCNELASFFERCLDRRGCFESLECLDGTTDALTIDEFMNLVHEEKAFLPGLLKNIWVMGDNEKIPEARIKRKWQISDSDTIYMYQNSAVFGTAFGGEGFLLTNSLICDLKSRKIVYLNQVKQVLYDEKEHTISVSDGKEHIVISLKDQKIGSQEFIFTFLEEFVQKYASLTPEEQHMLEVESAARKIENIIEQYAEYNGIDDEKQLLKDFLIKHNVLKQDKTIFCPYCGKQISIAAKFCNFCGKTNNYGKGM